MTNTSTLTLQLNRLLLAPPGPPPRPGLTWREETSRWVRPEETTDADEADNPETWPRWKPEKNLTELFHVTLAENVADIYEQGFKSAGDPMSEVASTLADPVQTDRIFFATDRRQADVLFAQLKEGGGEPAMIHLKVPSKKLLALDTREDIAMPGSVAVKPHPELMSHGFLNVYTNNPASVGGNVPQDRVLRKGGQKPRLPRRELLLDDVGHRYKKVLVKQAIECPHGLVSKPIIDRLGRHSHRCVHGGQEGPSVRLPNTTEEQDQARDLAFKELTGVDIAVDYPVSEGGHTRAVTAVRKELGVKDNQDTEVYKIIFSWENNVLANESHFILAAAAVIRGDYEEYSSQFGENSFPEQHPERLTKVVEALREDMKVEQDYWKSKGITHIKVYRGLDLPAATEDTLTPGDRTTVQDLPASSWSLYPGIASGFGDTVLMREVPVEDVITSFFSNIEGTREGEFVVYTPPEGAEVEVLR